METGFQCESKTLTELHGVLHEHPVYAGYRFHTLDLQTLYTKRYQDHRRRNGWWFFVFPLCQAQREMRGRGHIEWPVSCSRPSKERRRLHKIESPYMNTDEKLPKKAVPALEAGAARKQVLFR
jgi:hypothetical protein